MQLLGQHRPIHFSIHVLATAAAAPSCVTLLFRGDAYSINKFGRRLPPRMRTEERDILKRSTYIFSATCPPPPALAKQIHTLSYK